MNIKDIEGIGETYAEKLKDAGVRTTGELLKRGSSPKGRKELAAATGLTGHQILEWVNRADLYRIRGVGSEYADLLEAAGVDTVAELARRDASNLAEKLKAVNEAKKKVRRQPSVEQVGKWIEQAMSLPRAVEY
jgi:predicted flap endonuclease-1-like 5' DNA nuclease